MMSNLDVKQAYVIDLETTANGYEGSPDAVYPTNKVLMYGMSTIPNGNPYATFMWHEVSLDPWHLVGHNIKFDLKYLMRDHPQHKWHTVPIWDTMVAEYLLSGHTKTWLGLEALADLYGITYKKHLDLKSYLASGNKMEDIPEADLEKYVKEDVQTTFNIYLKQRARCSKQEENFIFTVCRKISALAYIELNGMYVDRDMMRGSLVKAATVAAAEEGAILKIIDTLYHPSSQALKLIKPMSSRTLSALLTGTPNSIELKGTKGFKETIIFDRPLLGDHFIDTIWEGESPNPNLGWSMREEIVNQLPAIPYVKDPILKYREANKLANTYYGPVLERIKHSASTKHLYTQLNNAATATGRLSSSSPNFQNMPPVVREHFIPTANDRVIMDIDFKQLELCALAHISEDRQLIDDIATGKDVHYEVGKSVMGWSSPGDMTKETRRIVKGVVFGIVYGAGPGTLAKTAGCDISIARKIRDAFYDRYRGVSSYHITLIEKVNKHALPDGFHKDGEQRYKSTLISDTGREWRLYTEKAPDFMKEKYSFSPTKAKNYPVQGFAGGDIVLSFLFNLYFLIMDGTKSNVVSLINTVHDSVVMEVHKNEIEWAKMAVNAAVQTTQAEFGLRVPLTVELETNDHWS